MAQFHDDDDDDDDSNFRSASRTGGRGRQRPTSRNIPSRGGASGSRDITAPALLIGGLVLVAGIGGMAAFRMAGLNESSSGETAEADPPVAESLGNAMDADIEPDDIIRIPEIKMPEDSDDFGNAGKPKPRTRPRATSGTEVTPPSDADNDSATNNSASTAAVIVPDAEAAVKMLTVDYSQSTPFADIATVNVVGKDRSRPLMARLDNVYLHFAKLPEDTRGAVTAAIQTGVQAGLERCRLNLSKEPGEPVMLIELSVLQNKVLMTATLIEKDQSDFLLMWQKSAQIGAVTDQALQQGILNSNLAREADAFFVGLRSILVDVRRQLGVK